MLLTVTIFPTVKNGFYYRTQRIFGESRLIAYEGKTKE